MASLALTLVGLVFGLLFSHFLSGHGGTGKLPVPVVQPSCTLDPVLLCLSPEQP